MNMQWFHKVIAYLKDPYQRHEIKERHRPIIREIITVTALVENTNQQITQARGANAFDRSVMGNKHKDIDR